MTIRDLRRIAAAALLTASCSGAQEDGVHVERTTSADTLVITSRGTVPVDTAGAPDIVWRSDELEDPVAMTMAGRTLIVADRERLHFIDLDAGAARTIGSAGEGPGEFRGISAVGVAEDGSVLVNDGRVLRITRLASDGGLMSTHRVTPAVPFVNYKRNRDVIIAAGGGVLVLREENVHVERPTRAALLWLDIEADTTSVLGEWDSLHFREYPNNFLAPAVMYGPQGVFAMSSERFAAGDGQDYCVNVHPVAERRLTSPVRVCREWNRPALDDAVKRPDLSHYEDPNLRATMEDIAATADIAENLPSYDAMLFADDGRLWVRTMPRELATLHPFAARRADARPPFRSWDSFDVNGELVRTVAVPAAFDVKLITPTDMYGFIEMNSGEIAVGAVELPHG